MGSCLPKLDPFEIFSFCVLKDRNNDQCNKDGNLNKCKLNNKMDDTNVANVKQVNKYEHSATIKHNNLLEESKKNKQSTQTEKSKKIKQDSLVENSKKHKLSSLIEKSKKSKQINLIEKGKRLKSLSEPMDKLKSVSKIPSTTKSSKSSLR